jgi:xyloglucan-specific exo-beta-1,4-glucanase
MTRKYFVALGVSLMMSGGARAQSSVPYTWKNVAVGGGGYITGLVAHPGQTNLLYARCDVGGAFRWDAASLKWTPLMDAQPRWNPGFDRYKVVALAIDKSDVNYLYAATGKYPESWWPDGELLRSGDKGNTWTKISPSNWGGKIGSDTDQRWGGERLAISPHDGNVLLYGAHSGVLWRTLNARAATPTWTQVTVGTSTANLGVNALVFNPWTAGSVYAAVWGDGIYSSTDNGSSWSKITGTPAFVRQLKIGWGGIFATHGSGVARGWGSGTWTDVTPPGFAGQVFGGLDTREDRVVVAQAEKGSPAIFYTSSGTGAISWSQKSITKTSTVPWWSDAWSYLNSDWLAGVAFEPWTAGPLWISHWFGTERTGDIAASPANFTVRVSGIENTVPMCLLSPPSGSELVSGHLDVDGFAHNNGLNSAPSGVFGGVGTDAAQTTNPIFQDTYSLACCESAPSTIYRVGATRYDVAGSKRGGVCKSTDGGLNWTQVKNWTLGSNETGVPMRVAVTRNSASKAVVVRANATAQFTANGGTTWNDVTGLPLGPDKRWYWNQQLCADLVNNDTFYYVSQGRFYRSTNGGSSFSEPTKNISLPNVALSTIKAMPGAGGEVWLSFGWDGLYRGVPNGASGYTFTKLANIGDARVVALGKRLNASSPAALYVYGSVKSGTTETWGVFRSNDRGATWNKIDVSTNALGNIGKDNDIIGMEGSRQTYGRVFILTDGRGIFYGNP